MSPEIEENMEGEVYSVAKHTLPFDKISSEFLRECYFALKAWNAQQAGAAAVLVADNIDEPLLTMDFPEMRTGMTPLLITRLDHQDAIARLNLLKLIKVCSNCRLRSSCKSGYLLTNKEDEARTIDLMRVLLAYDFDSINGSVL
ncbi:hypothetical protein OIU78_009206 [Salix suchowensis]|nr:hypothetical protein OIU78_009206 [Salix suchowensis]